MTVVLQEMSTKVHDDDDDETFDEVDVILENAKAGLQMKRTLERKTRRNINLSDIPENFAHVPASANKIIIKSEHSRSPPQYSEPVLQAGGSSTRVQSTKRSLLQATLRWFRDSFMVCASAVEHGTSCDMCGRSVVCSSVHVPSRRPRRRS